MSTNKKGFASFSEDKLRQVAIKGGKREVPKGFSILPKEERISNASRAAKIRWERVRAERREQLGQTPYKEDSTDKL